VSYNLNLIRHPNSIKLSLVSSHVSVERRGNVRFDNYLWPSSSRKYRIQVLPDELDSRYCKIPSYHSNFRKLSECCKLGMWQTLVNTKYTGKSVHIDSHLRITLELRLKVNYFNEISQSLFPSHSIWIILLTLFRQILIPVISRRNF
jgi:hypothetical protein